MTEQHDAPAEPMPEELFIDFANRAGVAIEATGDARAADVAALRTWLQRAGLARGRLAAKDLEDRLPRFRELRSLVRDVAERRSHGEPPTRAQVAALNAVMRDGLHYHALRAGGNATEFLMEPVGDALDQARSAVAGSLAHYLADHDAGRLRVCADDRCGWLFIDESPAGRRRWCDMRTCGNRAKVARHRERMRATSQGSRAGGRSG